MPFKSTKVVWILHHTVPPLLANAITKDRKIHFKIALPNNFEFVQGSFTKGEDLYS
jgi:hypothetical protein